MCESVRLCVRAQTPISLVSPYFVLKAGCKAADAVSISQPAAAVGVDVGMEEKLRLCFLKFPHSPAYCIQLSS